MPLEAIIKDPLSYLISPISKTEFFKTYHEKEALLSKHNDANRFHGLLSIDRIDEIIASTELPPSSLDMVRKEPPIERSYYTFQNGNIDRGAVIRHYQEGATIILPQLHLADEILAKFCRSLENVFSSHVQTNIYLTPGSSQGFNTHFDDHDVFVIQLSGTKKWRLYQKPIDNPYRGESFNTKDYKAGELQKEFELKEGECVYIPRGLMHDAISVGEKASLHITVGLIVKKWADLMLEALSEVAIRNPRFRRSLPPGFARPGYNNKSAKIYFDELINEFQKNSNFDKVFEVIKENFIRERTPNLRGSLIDTSSNLPKERLYIRRPNLQAKLKRDELETVIICGGGDLRFELKAYKVLQVILSGEPFSAASLGDSEDGSTLDMIKKLTAFGIIEPIKKP
ncbi:MAG: cupin domain-containing protein [Gammaproteobacteria bacterium]|nr:cupin domain-containing protein [Gammaproteobacteria bacterium]MEE3172556.1 cupin domain-containing protein [Pseudomonadota bacterium]|tara:strand:- start:455 stop:1648 length:1194 start_codon:yes stop_codon:yes gene_type:complete